MVKINAEKCIGCGLCVSICPKIFEMIDGKAKVKSQENEKCVEDAISSCPVEAISK